MTTTTTMMTLLVYVRAPLHIHICTRRSVIFISRVIPCTCKDRLAVSAVPRAPLISSFKIILRPEGHSVLSYPLRQITLARQLAPTAASRNGCDTGETGRSNGKTRVAEGREVEEAKEGNTACARTFAAPVIYTHALIA